MDFIGGGGGGGDAGGSSSGGGGGDHHDNASDDKQRKKRCHRHTAHQIQRLEATFKECPHPDEKTRNLLSRELGLHPRQIKFWFQNRRTQMKAKHERADNSVLRSENDKIRCENIAIREALKNIICPSCGGPPLSQDPYFDEQKLRIENAHLKEELDRLSSIAAKYIGRPISQLSPVQPIHISSLDLSIASFGPGHHGLIASQSPDLDLDLLPGSSSDVMPNLPFHPPINISDMEKSLMADTATNAVEELVRLLQSNEPLWIKSSDSRGEVLNFEAYDNIFRSNNNNSHLRNPQARVEASRDSGVVMMNGLALVDMFMDSNKYVELFPAIVSRAKTIEVISSGMLGNQSGRLQLMYNELQVLSALVPTRQLIILRLCQQIEPGSRVIVDLSYDIPHLESLFTSSSCKAQRLPSGCLIQEMPNGYAKVTWVEHWEVEDKAPIHNHYRGLIQSGSAFGATRWLSNLQRICERFTSLMVTRNSIHEIGGVMLSPEGKRSVMKLSQRMVNNFCCNINPPNGQRWTTVSGSNEFEVGATVYKTTDPGQPNGVILSASATIWLPIPSQNLFNFLSDERTRPQWDVLSNQSPVQEIAHITNGSNPGNSISVLRAHDTSQNSILILQESCTDSSGSLVIYSPIDLPAINLAMSGEDTSYIRLLPSGFTVSSDGSNDSASTSWSIGNKSSGSLLTVVLQILVSNSPNARMTPESVNTVNGLIGNIIQQIKTAPSLQ